MYFDHIHSYYQLLSPFPCLRISLLFQLFPFHFYVWLDMWVSMNILCVYVYVWKRERDVCMRERDSACFTRIVYKHMGERWLGGPWEPYQRLYTIYPVLYQWRKCLFLAKPLLTYSGMYTPWSLSIHECHFLKFLFNFPKTLFTKLSSGVELAHRQ